MGYEKFLESKQIQFLVIKDWYQEEALLNYWADEIAKNFKRKGETGLALKSSFLPTCVPIFALDFGDPYIDQIFENKQVNC